MSNFRKMCKVCDVHCTRYALVLLNIIFLVFGLIFLTLSIWLIAVPATKYVVTIATSSAIQEQIYKLCYVTIGITTFTCVLSLVGFCGTLNNYSYIYCLSGFFFVLLLISEIAIGVIAVFLQETVRSGMEFELRQSLGQYSGDDATDAISIGWKEAQQSFDCCGVNTEAGYQNHTNVLSTDAEGNEVSGSMWYRVDGQALGIDWPSSCCNNDSTCYTDQMDGLNQQGCLPSISSFVRNHLILFAILSFVLVVFQTFGILCSCLMHQQEKRMRPIEPVRQSF